MSNILKGLQLNELSNEKLAKYKTAAATDAKKADSEGDYKRGDKRFSGIVKATKKQFANDEKQDVDEAYGRNSYAYRKDGGANDERHDLDPSEWYFVKDDKMFKVTVYPRQEQEAIARGYSRTRAEAKAKADQQGVAEGEGNFAGDTPVNLGGDTVKRLQVGDTVKYFGQKAKILAMSKTGNTSRITIANDMGGVTKDVLTSDLKRTGLSEEELDENLHKWFKEKWVRFGPDGKIRGDCARGDDSEGKPKCLPQSKAQNLGKKGRASAASRKRREDPNPERSGKAINVNTKKKTDEAELDEACWKGYHKEGNKKMFGKTYPNCVKNTNEELDMTEGWKEEAQDLEDWSKEVNMRLYRAHESQRPALARQLSKLEQKHFGSEFTHPNLTNVVWSALRALQKGDMVHYDPQSVGQMPFGNIVGDDAKLIAQYNITRDELAGYRMLHDKGMVDNLDQFLKLRRLVRAKSWPLEYYEELEQLTPEEAWLKMANDLNWSKDSMTEEVQAKTDDNLRAYYAQRKAEKEKHHSESCPHCGGEMVSEELMNEKKDACYYKVKSRYKVWPSAYASGALVKCRKKGADSWGNGGKSNESIEEDQLDEKWTKKYKDSINCSNPKGFSQKAHCAGKQKNESAILKGLKL